MIRQQIQKWTTELIGTFALTFIGAGAIITTAWTGGEPGLLGIAIAHGLALSIAVSAAMNVSGGHINPAVTIAMFVTGRIRFSGAVGYIVAQCLGATIAGFALSLIFNAVGAPINEGVTGATALRVTSLGTPNFGHPLTPVTAVVIEALLTFLLVFSVFGTAVDPRAPKIGGFGIGLTICMDILMGGPLTGAAMNPARTIGPLIAGGSDTAGLWSQHWVYWVGPTLGGTVAAIVYDTLILGRRPSE